MTSYRTSQKSKIHSDNLQYTSDKLLSTKRSACTVSYKTSYRTTQANNCTIQRRFSSLTNNRLLRKVAVQLRQVTAQSQQDIEPLRQVINKL